ncbi:MAG: aminoacyl-tRNA hydrolase [Actinobacteria bacterium]|nr:aminoacyl-tRNA hydrolase [Actinomycetota bacterium]
MDDPIVINGGLRIPLREIQFRTSRSSGPGGQHANVTDSRVEAIFDVRESESLSERQRELIVERCGGPVVRAIAQDARSQTRNRELAVDRLREKLVESLKTQRARRPTRPSRGSKERRLKEKRQRSEHKRGRKPPRDDD